jgi:hypothetical protein
VAIADTLFTDNAGMDGGGLFNNGGTVTIARSMFVMNTARPGAGGGVANPSGTMTITKTTFANNFTGGGGGGALTNGGTVIMTDSTLVDNRADFGMNVSAIAGFLNAGGAILTNTTIARSCCERGGGLANRGTGIVILTNSTLADNLSEGLTNFGAEGTVVLTNTILARNNSDCGGPVTSLGHNLIGDVPTGCMINNNAPGTLPNLQPTDLTGDPGLGPFTDDGTPGNGHFPLLAGSQAIDAGNDAFCPFTDQLGDPRVGHCDIGAIEFRGQVRPVTLYTGYLFNFGGSIPDPADIPTPFDPDATTILISSGGVATLHDTGVIRFENRNNGPVTIDPGLRVTTAQAVFQLWDSFLPITLTPGQNLVLAETANFNFDTSNSGLSSDPVVSGSVNGRAFSFTDTARVLLGRDDAGSRGGNETIPYQVIGRIEVP